MINIIIISLITLFLLIIIRLDKIIDTPNIYLKSTLIIVLMILLIDQLIYLDCNFAVFLQPVSYAGYFTIYPLIYYYTRQLVFYKKEIKRQPLIIFLIFPIIIFIAVAIIFYPLTYEEKMIFVRTHLSENSESFPEFHIFQLITIPAYYLQTLFYVVLTFSLVKVVKKNINSDGTSLMLIRYILFYVGAVLLFEALLVIINLFLPMTVYQIRVFELISTLLFVLFGMYILFNQTMILVQTRLVDYSAKIEKSSKSPISSTIFSEVDKLQVKESIDKFLQKTKLYLDPNLSLEMFSKRVHIPSRKISKVVNSIFSKNFHQYINEFRITAAIEMMHSGGIKNIESLYTKVGFNSRSTFNRVFRENTGKSPSEYFSQRKSA